MDALIYGLTKAAGLRAKRIVIAFALATSLAVPTLSKAQGSMPLQWLFNSISGPSCTAFTPDGAMLAVGGDGGLQIYDAHSGVPIRSLSLGIDHSVQSLAFTADGKTLAAGSSGDLQLWNVADSRLIKLLHTGLTTIRSTKLSADGSIVVVGGLGPAQDDLEVWNVVGSTKLKTLQSAATEINSVALSPDGKLAVAGGQTATAGTAEVWNLANGNQVASLLTAEVPVVSVAISPNSQSLAVGGQVLRPNGSYAGSVEVWSLSSFTLKQILPTTQTSISAVDYSPDGSSLADSGNGHANYPTYTNVGEIEIWDTATGYVSRSGVNHLSAISTMSFSPDSQTVAIGGSYTWDRLFDVGYIRILQIPSFYGIVGSTTGSDVLSSTPPVFSPDGKSIIGGGARLTDGTVDLWNASTGTWLANLNTGYFNPIGGCVYSPDGSTIAIGLGNGSGSVQLWDASTCTLRQTLTTNATAISSVKFSPDGSKLAVGGSLANSSGDLEVWSVKTGQRLVSIGTGANQSIKSVAFSTDSSLLADCGFSTDGATLNQVGVVEVWQTSDARLIASYATSTTIASSIAFSRDGSNLAVAGQSGSARTVLEIWSLAKGTAVRPFLATGASGLGFVTYSLDGKTLYLAGNSSIGIEGFRTSDYAMLGYFSDDAISMAVSPDGTRLAYMSRNNDLVVGPIPIFTSFNITGLLVAPTSVEGGNLVSGTVTLAYPAPASGVTVKLESSGSTASVPASLFIPAGALTATFEVTTSPSQTKASLSITASSGPHSQSADLTITPPTVALLSVTPSTIAGGNKVYGSVTLGGPAFTGGVMVTLTSSNSAAVVPLSIAIPGGQTTGTFTITTSGVDAKTTASITATLNGASRSASLSVIPAFLSHIVIAPASVFGGYGAKATVVLTGASGPTGLDVSLSSSDPAVTVPPKVTIQPGMSSASFSVVTNPVPSNRVVALTVKASGVSRQVNLTVIALQLRSLSLSPSVLTGGAAGVGTVRLTSPAPANGLNIALSSNSQLVKVPNVAKIPAGFTSANFAIKTYRTSAPTKAVVTASLFGTSVSANLTVR